MDQLPTMDRAALIERIRANIAFEHMVAASLKAAVFGALVYLGVRLASHGFLGVGARAVAGILFDAAFVGFVAFLAGFFFSVVVGLPLFARLEEQKYRKAWPWVVAPTIIAAAVVILIAKIEAATPIGAALVSPAFFFSYFFLRAIDPLWRAKAAEEAQSARTIIRIQ